MDNGHAAARRGTRSLHGIEVEEPEIWLADASTPEARAWVEAQDTATTQFLAQCPGLPGMRAFLERNYVAVDPVWSVERGARRFTLARRPDQPQLVLCVDGRVLYDPNPAGLAISPDEVRVSDDGRFVALLLTRAGEVLGSVHVLDAATGAVLEAAPFQTVMPIVAWHPRGHGFHYSLCRRLFGEFAGPRDGLYWHALGTKWETDRCIKPYHDGPGHIAHATVATLAGSHWLVIGTRQFSSGESGYEIAPLPDDPARASAAAGNARVTPPARLFADLEGYVDYLGAAGGVLYFHTSVGAPNGRIVGIDPRQPARAAWRTIVAEGQLPLARPERFGGPPKSAVGKHGLMVTLVEDAKDVLRHVALDGAPIRALTVPVHATIDGVFATAQGFRVHWQSYLVPAATHEYRADSGAFIEVERAGMPDIDPSAYELRQEFCTGRDGTRIPLYVLHRKGLVRDGRTPTLLYGYGGFSQSITPEYSPAVALWLALGGVYAVANIRGGGEYGEAWHRAGSGVNKQNTFDDFYAAAEYLIASGYTSAANLVARGLSNGGLLTAVANHQRPDLFAAIVSEIPLVDMLGLDDTPTGTAVAAEYGSAKASREQFEVLRRYSPLHNVRPGRMPAQMVVVAEQDGSAPPPQAYRYVAARQAAVAQSEAYAPVLLRVVRGEGHTGWRPENTRGAVAEETAFLHHFATVGRRGALRHKLDVRVPLRDGVTLSANVWLPASGDPRAGDRAPTDRHPAVLLRTPYDNDRVQFERLGLRAYAEAGYAVVFQSVRGRGKSAGEFGFFLVEGADGYDSVEWLATQPWCDGQVAMDGGSYLGTAQWLAARERPPHLKAIMPAVPAGDWFNEIPYIGGALQVDWAFCWLGAMAGIAFDFTDGGHKNLEAFRPLVDAERKLGAKLPFYQEILRHSTPDDWYRPMRITPEEMARIDIPVLTTTGWFDGDQAGAMHHWCAHQKHAPHPERAQLIVGPWEHAPCYLGGTSTLGDMAFGDASILPMRDLRLAFLDRHLGGERSGAGASGRAGRDADAEPRARVFVTGENRWRALDAYPPPDAEMQQWHLHGSGRANTAAGDGRLALATASGAPDTFRFDPADPVPYRRGAVDHREIEQCADVLVYTSEPLREPLTVIGLVETILHIASSAPDTDFTAKLLDVYPDGRAVSLTHVGGVLRARYRKGYDKPEPLVPGKPAELRIRLSHVGHCFLPGHRIRLEVSSSCFPLADPHPNSYGDIAAATKVVVAQQTVFHEAAHPSHLLLPVVKPESRA